MHDREIAQRLEQNFAADLKRSIKVSYEEWDARGFKEKFFALFAFPVEEQL